MDTQTEARLAAQDAKIASQAEDIKTLRNRCNNVLALGAQLQGIDTLLFDLAAKIGYTMIAQTDGSYLLKKKTVRKTKSKAA